MGKEAKTNAMRILERAKVAYTAHEYPHEEGVAVDGIHVAQSMGEDPACVYKTLVTQGASRNYFVFVIPVAAELDLKAAARSVGEKSVAMIHVADINKVTGYVRGGCSPVGMKKQYVTVFDESVLAQEKVYDQGYSWNGDHDVLAGGVGDDTYLINVNQRPIVSRCQRPNFSSCSG